MPYILIQILIYLYLIQSGHSQVVSMFCFYNVCSCFMVDKDLCSLRAKIQNVFGLLLTYLFLNTRENHNFSCYLKGFTKFANSNWIFDKRIFFKDVLLTYYFSKIKWLCLIKCSVKGFNFIIGHCFGVRKVKFSKNIANFETFH